jgi:hypothetical protein
MAHYDSVMEDLFMNPTKSTGAIDDGYGVVTLLQIAEHFIKNNRMLTNGIKFLLTDSEETGPLEGSKLEIAQNSDFYKDISLIINIEARGFDGPVAMIQTSKGNSRVIELYRKANHRFTNSIITELFGFMVNFTDLSPFLDAGFSGLNFGTIGHMKYYHSDEDNLDNVNSDTLNHYGEQIMPIITEFVYNSTYSEFDYFKSSEDSTFFILLPGLFVSYRNTLNIVLLLISFILLAVLVFMGSKKNILSKKQCFIALSRWLLYTIVCVIAGAITSVLIAFLADIPLYPMMMVNYPFDTQTLITVIVLLFCCSIVMVIRQAKKHGTFLEMLIGGIALNLLIALLCVLLLPGCVFLFLLPAFAALLIFWIQMKLKHRAIKIVIAALLTTLILLYAPLLYILYYALTIGSLFVFAFILAIGFSLFTPLACMACNI